MSVARVMVGTVAAALLVVGISATPTLATTAAIGPNQHYLGYVNGKHVHAIIRVVCPGPAGGNRTGPPIEGQTLTVRRGSSGGGDTGTFAHEIWAEFGKDALHVVGFASYNTPKAIPTGLRLPCGGTGTVTFTTCFGTLPCASNAKDDVVHVTFANIAV
jgi:hypothetical protein